MFGSENAKIGECVLLGSVGVWECLQPTHSTIKEKETLKITVREVESIHPL